MSIKQKHFVRFFSPGTFCSEVSIQEIDSLDTTKAVKMAKDITERYNARPYGFRFETNTSSDPIPDGNGGFLKVESRLDKSSGIYYIGGKVFNYDQIKDRNNPDDNILLSNMRNNCPLIVEITNGYLSTMPFEENDSIVDSDTGNIIVSGATKEYVEYRKKLKELVWGQ